MSRSKLEELAAVVAFDEDLAMFAFQILTRLLFPPLRAKTPQS